MKILNLIQSLLILVALVTTQNSIALVEDEDTVVTQLKALKAQCAQSPDKVGCYELGINVLIGETSDQYLIDLQEALSRPGVTTYGSINGFQFLISAETQQEFRDICLDKDVQSMPKSVKKAEVFINGNTVFRKFEGDGIVSRNRMCSKLETIAIENGLVDSQLPKTTAEIDFSINRGKESHRVPVVMGFTTLDEVYRECVSYFNSRGFQENKADYITFSINGDEQLSEYNGSSYWDGAENNCNVLIRKIRDNYDLSALGLR